MSTTEIEPPTTHEEAARRIPQMDWQQVALNGGPPCFALLDDEVGWFCGRAERWEGHDGEHEFVSLSNYIATYATTVEHEAMERAVAGLRATRENFISVNRALEIVVNNIRAAGTKES